MLVIQDAESEKYLSERSFWTMDGINWSLFAYTGKLGASFFSSADGAGATLERLQECNKKSGFKRILHIIDVDLNSLLLGETVKVL